MNLSSIDLNLLVALDALLSEAHVGRAARKIGLSQPAASHALKRLRDLLDDPLLVRAGSRMELTPRATGLRESLAETLQRVQGLLLTDSFDPARSTRHFSVMMQDHIGHLIVPELVSRLRSEAPGISLNILPWESTISMRPEQLRSIDLLISCVEHEVPAYQRETLFTDTEVTVVRKGHPSASKMKNLKTFLSSRHVAVVGRGLTEDPVDTWLQQEGLAPTGCAACSELFTGASERCADRFGSIRSQTHGRVSSESIVANSGTASHRSWRISIVPFPSARRSPGSGVRLVAELNLGDL